MMDLPPTSPFPKVMPVLEVIFGRSTNISYFQNEFCICFIKYKILNRTNEANNFCSDPVLPDFIAFDVQRNLVQIQYPAVLHVMNWKPRGRKTTFPGPLS